MTVHTAMIDVPTSSLPFSWNSHALLTRSALAQTESGALNEIVLVTRLEDFVSAAEKELVGLSIVASKRLNRKPMLNGDGRGFRKGVANIYDFLTAFKVNPSTEFHYVRVVSPDQVSPDSPHCLGRSGPPAGSYQPTAEREQILSKEVLITFADEPDWGMDQDLFIQSYGYGHPPYGGKTGQSSQAPFHMAFFDKSLILPKIFPVLKISFLEYRVIGFLDLADLAFAKNVPYWGWRFTAWATHYLQDLTQPYHAYPFPPSAIWLIRILAWRRSLKGLARRIGNILKNRHMLCEAIVHFLLNDAVKKRVDHPFLAALASATETRGASLEGLMKESARTAVSIARSTDRLMVSMIADPRIQDPDFLGGHDLSLPLESLLRDAARNNPTSYKGFVERICLCLKQTGRATRLAVENVVRSRPCSQSHQ